MRISDWSSDVCSSDLFYGNKVRLRFNAQVPLPNLNRHLSAFIGRDDNDDFIQDRFDNSTLRNNFPNVDDHEKVFAGLGYSLPGSERFDTDFRIGVHGLAPPKPFCKGGVAYTSWTGGHQVCTSHNCESLFPSLVGKKTRNHTQKR